MLMDYTSMSDVELSARMAERIGFRFESNDGGTAFRLVDLEWETSPWRSTLEEAWRDAPNFIKQRFLWDDPDILVPLGRNAWQYWHCLNDLRGKSPATQRLRTIAFLMTVPPTVCLERPPGYGSQITGI
jgi:hypothetical protein